ncbi:Rrf2 family transcriptional regulator [Clostridium sardiniense]|uniref:Rrf2 family transcriptional regulator n=1 Tax=Clostridium sardiniense TaxID=29369 RepID=A0ABS7KY92_CLOSR|nr:Rrf2 family transcriptional regulator [Clostridium sardiniense]MBM7835785.1 Rrf2 family protein [Clostridium sardiniense]MBY0755781.1 Rrf2 family transcriptional regulator [Clostridium sardiniense]MDQ0459991.1 Rrf2 family protein [Clostridium sardiniense]
MKISTKGRYGLKALIDIYMYSSCETVTLKSVSKRQDISEKYLEQIFSSLRKDGIIEGKKGPQGGYFLTRDAKTITVGEILRSLEGKLVLIDNEKDNNQLSEYLYENLWDVINKKINEYFDSITLEELANNYKYSIEDIAYYI